MPETCRLTALNDDIDDDAIQPTVLRLTVSVTQKLVVQLIHCRLAFIFHRDIRRSYPLESHSKSSGSSCGRPFAAGESWHILGLTLLPSPVYRDVLLGLALERNILSAATTIHLVEHNSAHDHLSP